MLRGVGEVTSREQQQEAVNTLTYEEVRGRNGVIRGLSKPEPRSRDCLARDRRGTGPRPDISQASESMAAGV